MFRFLRRVFIILVLLIIVFFVFRLVKPEATSRFVDKVKSIPTTISSRFHREKKSNIVINGDTTFSSGNFETNENYIIDSNDSDNSNNSNDVVDSDINNEEGNNSNNNDLSRLEELNREIDAILASGNNNESVDSELNEDGIVNNESNGLGSVEIDNNSNQAEIIELEPGAIEQPEYTGNLSDIIGEVLNSGNSNTQQGNNENQSSTQTNNQNTSQTNNQDKINTSTILTEQQRGDCAQAGLTVQDCEDLVRDFGNFN